MRIQAPRALLTTRRAMKPYTVGISIWVNANGDMGLFENGLRQNVVFLYNLFRAASNCRRVVLLNHGESDTPVIPAGIPVRRGDIVRGAMRSPSGWIFVIVLGSAMDAATIARFREQGSKIICYKGGNGIVISMEAMIAQPPWQDAERYFDKGFLRCDLDDAATHPHLSILLRGHLSLPGIRGPADLAAAVPAIETRRFVEAVRLCARHKKAHRHSGSNITVMKTSHMPMLVCEAAYRKKPALFGCHLRHQCPAIYMNHAFQRLREAAAELQGQHRHRGAALHYRRFPGTPR